jgi:hypothetical protein
MTGPQKLELNRKHRGAGGGDLTTEASLLFSILRGPVANDLEPSQEDFQDAGRLLYQMVRERPAGRILQALAAFERSLSIASVDPHPDLFRLLHYLHEKNYPGSTEDGVMRDLAEKGISANSDRRSVCIEELRLLFPQKSDRALRRLATEQVGIPYLERKRGPKRA